MAASCDDLSGQLGKTPDESHAMDRTIDRFMFPVSICIATTAMLSGIDGAALSTPVFIIVFPLIGPGYPLATPAAG